jgi:hypothetical protein
MDSEVLENPSTNTTGDSTIGFDAHQRAQLWEPSAADPEPDALKDAPALRKHLKRKNAQA